jgi:hypothetical protein
LHTKFVNGNTIFTADPKQPSLATDPIYSSKVETARTDDDFQGFKADDNFKVRSEETPNHEPFVTTPYASQTFAYPRFMHMVQMIQSWQVQTLKNWMTLSKK